MGADVQAGLRGLGGRMTREAGVLIVAARTGGEVSLSREGVALGLAWAPRPAGRVKTKGGAHSERGLRSTLSDPQSLVASPAIVLESMTSLAVLGPGSGIHRVGGNVVPRVNA